MIDWFKEHKGKTAAFMAYQPTQSFHVVQRQEDGLVTSINHIGTSGLYINSGYFILRQDIFDYMEKGDELVNQPFQRLIKKNRLVSWEHKGFWASMDTYKDKQTLDEAYARGVLEGLARKWKGMEEWKNGRLEEWKIGRLEEWKIEGMEDWKNGRLEDWKIGRMEDWKNGRMEKWKNGRLDK